jgi:hypothetical protein
MDLPLTSLLFRTNQKPTPSTQTPTRIPACTGANIAPLTTTNPDTSTNIPGTIIQGLYGLANSGSFHLSTNAPRAVRKKKLYSPKPLNVNNARKLPNRIYSAERIDERRSALSGASDLEVVLEVNLPTRERNDGSQDLFAAATVMRPATKEFPRREPATTRQTRIAAMMPPAGPVRRVIAVYEIYY